VEAMARIENNFSLAAEQWDELKSPYLAARNRQLSSANQMEIRTDSHGETQEGEDQVID
jgi:hypothetical protein